MRAILRILLTFLAVSAAYADDTVDSTQLIAKYGLREAAEPVSNWPRWRVPQRIAVDGAVPGLTDAIRSLAPNAAVVAAANVSEMTVAAADADVMVGRSALICNDAVLAAAKNLRWLQSVYAGVESCVSNPALLERDILLTNMRAIGGPVIAEHAIGLLLGLSRGLHVTIPRQAKGEWLQNYPAESRVTVLHGKTMLVVGLGGIGSEVAERANALGMRVIATRASDAPSPAFIKHVGKPDELMKLLGEADVVVNTAPLTTETRGLFDAKVFAGMKRTAYFINVARGASVVTDDLVDALVSYRIAGAGLDVTEPEPLPSDHPLWRAPNLVLTPHVAGDSDLGVGPQLQLLRENLRRYQAGERMLSVVDLRREY